MSDAYSAPYPMDEDDSRSGEGRSSKPPKWEVVATAPGLTPAQVIAGRLQAEGIPARAWQEGAGRAAGLVVGLLGTGYVEVPEQFVEQALDILGSAEDYVDEDEFGDADEDET